MSECKGARGLTGARFAWAAVPCLPWLCLYALRVAGRAGRERRVGWLHPPCQLPQASEKLALLIFFFV
jgi:hypothetical protein